MMDIDSKEWRIRSHAGPLKQLTNKKTGEIRIVQYDRGEKHLAAISEKQFNEEMQQAFRDSK